MDFDSESSADFTRERVDRLLPYLLKRDNVARYQEGAVLITDRRKFPFEKSLYRCETVEEVARAIEKMVTQGGGPWVAAPFALASAARKAEDKSDEKFREALRAAEKRLVETRPTNTAMSLMLTRLVDTAWGARQEGKSGEEAILRETCAIRDEGYRSAYIRGQYGADLIADGDGIITMCFAEDAFLLALALAKEAGKEFTVFVPETRPYLQGARLTAPSVQELDIPVTLITDNMPAHIISRGKVDKYFTAADLITLDGHVVNKVGTYQIALAAQAHAVPYFAFMWGADQNTPDRDSIQIEERNPEEIRSCRGESTTLDNIPAYYPAFDITPPYLVSGIITLKGVFSPYDLVNHYQK